MFAGYIKIIIKSKGILLMAHTKGSDSPNPTPKVDGDTQGGTNPKVPADNNDNQQS